MADYYEYQSVSIFAQVGNRCSRTTSFDKPTPRCLAMAPRHGPSAKDAERSAEPPSPTLGSRSSVLLRQALEQKASSLSLARRTKRPRGEAVTSDEDRECEHALMASRSARFAPWLAGDGDGDSSVAASGANEERPPPKALPLGAGGSHDRIAALNTI